MVSFSHTIAQQIQEPFTLMGEEYRYSLMLQGNVETGTAALDNAFLSSYYLGKFLNKDMKDRVKARLSDENRLGADVDAGIFFYQKADSSFGNGKLDVFGGIKNRIHADGLYTDELFNMYFYGNKNYENQNVKFGKSNFRFFEYQEIQAGIRKKIIKDDNKWVFTLGLSAISGQNYFGFENYGSELFTATDGEYLDIKTKVEYKKTSDKNTSFGAGNGVGTAILLHLEYQKGKNSFHFSVSDLGFINWNSRSSVITADTVFRFRGIQMKNIFDSLEVSFSDTGFVNSLYNKNEKKSFISVLPAWFIVGWDRNFTDKLSMGFSGRYRLNANYIPQFRLDAKYRFSSLLTAGVNLQYGGYATIGAGLHLQSELGKGFRIALGTNYLDGLLLSEDRSAQNVYFSVLKMIK